MRPWTGHARRKYPPVDIASMGPRPCGRGRGQAARRRPAAAGFNGATALRPWTDHHRPPVANRRVASMGPRPCGRGRARPPGRNGGGGGLQWGHGLAAVDGAQVAAKLATASGLQWGHGLAAVDGHDPDWFTRAANAASMGPRPCGRGRPLVRRDRDRPPPASMGPRPCGRGRNAQRRALYNLRPASMGPRPCGRGRMCLARGPGQIRTGFNGATALRPWTVYSRPFPPPPSATLQWGHGLAAVDGCPRRRLCRRLYGLQWGHGLAAVDGRMFGHDPDPDSMALQWGHGLAAVDGGAGTPGSTIPRSFNGATALRPWTEAQGAEAVGMDKSFNGATALRPWTGDHGDEVLRR